MAKKTLHLRLVPFSEVRRQRVGKKEQEYMQKNTKKTNTRKLSRKGAVEKDTTKKESKESMVKPLKMNQIGEKTLALGLTIKGLSTVELIKNIQRAEGNFDCFGTADRYCDQWECCWRTLCLS